MVYPTIHPDTHLAGNKSKLQNTQIQFGGHVDLYIGHPGSNMLCKFSYFDFKKMQCPKSEFFYQRCLQENIERKLVIVVCGNLKKVTAHFSKVLQIGFCGKFSMNNLTRNAILKQSLLKVV